MIYLKCTLTPHTRCRRDHSGVHSFLPRSSTRSFWGCNIPQWLLETKDSMKVLKPAWQFGAELSAVAQTFTEEVPTSNTCSAEGVSRELLSTITEPQSRWGWKGPLEIL